MENYELVRRERRANLKKNNDFIGKNIQLCKIN